MQNNYDHVLKTGCKVNLYLEVLGLRDDGYHEIVSLFIPINNPSDHLFIRRKEDYLGLSLKCSVPELEGKNNILDRVYLRFGRLSGFWPGLDVYLKKNIPRGAGLGGGSSNAAAFLNYLNIEADKKGLALNESQLLSIAQELGSDIPFFLQNKPAWVLGKGEQVCPQSLDWAGIYILIINSGLEIDTGLAYRELDKNLKNTGGYTLNHSLLTRERLKIKEIMPIKGLFLINCFEEIIYKKYPILSLMKIDLLKKGAAGVVLSGTGSSQVAIFRNKSTYYELNKLCQQKECNCYLNKIDLI